MVVYSLRSGANCEMIAPIVPKSERTRRLIPFGLTVVAVRTVLAELSQIFPARTIPARLAPGVPGL